MCLERSERNGYNYGKAGISTITQLEKDLSVANTAQTHKLPYYTGSIATYMNHTHVSSPLRLDMGMAEYQLLLQKQREEQALYQKQQQEPADYTNNLLKTKEFLQPQQKHENNESKDSKNKRIFGVGISGSAHFMGGVTAGKEVYIDRNGNIVLINSSSATATTDIELSAEINGGMSKNELKAIFNYHNLTGEYHGIILGKKYKVEFDLKNKKLNLDEVNE